MMLSREGTTEEHSPNYFLHFLLTSIFIHVTQIRGRNLQGVEQNSGFFRFEAAVQQMFANHGDGRLDRGGVIQKGHVKLNQRDD